ncbi:MAG: nickel pincer cofactor biosynthesis protein LarC [Actinomycetaceae bacterium]|nr:nickel pincer cofactor biosynthesis protein LarC [Actinomycetaceae bacterium]
MDKHHHEGHSHGGGGQSAHSDHAHGHSHSNGHTHSHDGAHTHSVVSADGHEIPRGETITPTQIAPDPAASRTLFIDVSAGASGDMLLGALLDAGADAGSVAAVLDAVIPGQVALQRRQVVRGPFAALKVDVVAREMDPPARHLSDIRALLDNPAVPEKTRRTAVAAFELIAQAEARAHGMSIEDVHFHEVGALDSIGDVVGVAEALRTLGVESAWCGTVAVGAGHVHTQHGILSVPPPAVLNLADGWRIEAGGPPDVGELCTPTGMALLRVVCEQVEVMPPIQVASSGSGAGTRIRPDRDGLLRVIVGESSASTVSESAHADGAFEGRFVAAGPWEGVDPALVECNIDDLDPRLWPGILDALLAAGAKDAWLTPILMKKGRPAHILSALCSPTDLERITEEIFARTSTIGLRILPVSRQVLDRCHLPVKVRGHDIRVKVSGRGGRITTVTPEFDDCQSVAQALGMNPAQVLAEAGLRAQELGMRPGENWPQQGVTCD